MPKNQEITVLDIAEGSIDPQTRLAAGEITQERLDDFVEALQDPAYYTDIDPLQIPNECVDGRLRKDGQARIGACAAGGTFSVVMGDALTNGEYLRAGETAADHARRIYEVLTARGQQIGVHDDDHNPETPEAVNCGCGAEDKLDADDAQKPSILKFIERKGKSIHGLLTGLGIEVSEELHNVIVARASTLRQEYYAANGARLRATAKAVAGDAAVVTLAGSHNEVALNILTRPGKTLDRQKLFEEFGEDYQAFELDAPSLKVGAEQISSSPEDAHNKYVASLYYNAATAGVLAGPSLRIVTS